LCHISPAIAGLFFVIYRGGGIAVESANEKIIAATGMIPDE
jgi:hypothetical protein